MKTQQHQQHHQRPPQGSPLYWHVRGYSYRLNGRLKVISRKDYGKALAKYHQDMAKALNPQIAPSVSPALPSAAPVTPEPQVEPVGCTVELIRQRFLSHKQQKLREGEIQPGSYMATSDCTKAFMDFYPGPWTGLTIQDFARFREQLAGYKVHTRDRYITQVRAMFRWAVDNDVIPHLPRYGTEFQRPGRAAKEKHQNQVRLEKGAQLWTGPEIRKLLAQADPMWQAMILLAVNAGLKNGDLGALRVQHLHLDEQFLDFPRPKTHKPRQAHLWKSTVKAIRLALSKRPVAQKPEYEQLVFRTLEGLPVCSKSFEQLAGGVDLKMYDAIPHLFAALRQKAKLGDGKGFSLLRHATRTYGATGDREALDLVMGHGFVGVRGAYTEPLPGGYLVAPERLRRISQAIYVAVFGKPNGKCKPKVEIIRVRSL